MKKLAKLVGVGLLVGVAFAVSFNGGFQLGNVIPVVFGFALVIL